MVQTAVWKGDATPIAQIDTVEITGFIAADVYTLTVNGRTINVSGIVDEETTVTAIVSEIEASDIPEFQEVLAVSAGPTISLTARTPGKPFTITSSVTAGGGTIGAVTNTVPSSGPNHWDTAENWDTGVVPGTGDTIYIGQSSSSILYGLNQWSAPITLASLNVLDSYTGRIGVPRINTDNADGNYVDYRENALSIGATLVVIDGSNALQMNFDLNTAQTLTTINATGAADESGTPACLITGTHAANNIVVNKGEVGIGFFADGAATDFPTLGINYVTIPATDVTVYVGELADIGSVTQNGGTVFLDGTTAAAGAERVLIYQGVCHLNQAAGTIIGVTIYGGTVFYSTAATLTTLIMSGNPASVPTLDFRRGDFGPTITNASIHAASIIYDPVQTATWTNGLDLVECSLANVTLDLGKNQSWARTAI